MIVAAQVGVAAELPGDAQRGDGIAGLPGELARGPEVGSFKVEAVEFGLEARPPRPARPARPACSANSVKYARWARRASSGSSQATSCSAAYSRIVASRWYRSCSTRTRDLSASLDSRSSTWSGAISPKAATRSAAASENPPENTASRRNTARSSAASRSWLQSRVARSAWCRAGADLAPPVSTPNTSPSRSVSCRTDSTRIRAAASSIASGSPSKLLAQLADRGRVGVGDREGGATSRARSAKSSTASASPSGGTGQARSPSTASGSRLVASTDSPGHSASRYSVRPGDGGGQVLAVVEHHQQRPGGVVRGHVPGDGRGRIDARRLGHAKPAARPGRPRRPGPPPAPARPTRTSVPADAVSAAAASASLVLPAPPGPFSVRRRLPTRALVTAPSSTSRPTSGVSRTGSPRRRQHRHEMSPPC